MNQVELVTVAADVDQMDVMANLQNDRRVKIRMDDMNQRSFEE
jgi:hypothetical protein